MEWYSDVLGVQTSSSPLSAPTSFPLVYHSGPYPASTILLTKDEHFAQQSVH